jgi:hypothetical protein
VGCDNLSAETKQQRNRRRKSSSSSSRQLILTRAIPASFTRCGQLRGYRFCGHDHVASGSHCALGAAGEAPFRFARQSALSHGSILRL